jgi:hypothetical protein
MKTSEEYVKDPASCPFCGSTDIEGGNFDVDDGLSIQKVYCLECDKEWLDCYQLTGYLEVK